MTEEKLVEEGFCVDCGEPATEAVVKFSTEKYGKVLCFLCQQKQTGKETDMKTVVPKGVPEEYIITLQGKKFITHQGLLHVAHENGLTNIHTELLEQKIDDLGKPLAAIFKAVVTLKENTFVGHGDATTENVNANIQPHLIRMAETRAVNRALRLATNIGMCSAEELGGKK